jgi:hypothetical protein
MIGKAELTQALALVAGEMMTRPISTFNRAHSYQPPRKGKYGRNLTAPASCCVESKLLVEVIYGCRRF